MIKLLLISMFLAISPVDVELSEPEEIPIHHGIPEEGRLKDIAVVENYIWDNVCSVDKDFKSYMDYRTITNTESKQWYLQQHAETIDGHRIYEDRLMVAMAGYQVGQKLDLYLESGQILEVVIGDIKANTDCQHPDGSVVEFIVDENEMDPFIREMGSYHYTYKGVIEKVKIYE